LKDRQRRQKQLPGIPANQNALLYFYLLRRNYLKNKNNMQDKQHINLHSASAFGLQFIPDGIAAGNIARYLLRFCALQLNYIPCYFRLLPAPNVLLRQLPLVERISFPSVTENADRVQQEATETRHSL
jgi:hypothetical protein